MAGYAEGQIFVKFPANVAASAGCSSQNTLVLKRDSEKLYSMAMAAMLSGKKMSCLIGTVCEGPAGGYTYALGNQCIITD